MSKVILMTIITMVFTGIALSAEKGSIQSGGQTRTYLVHVPSRLPERPNDRYSGEDNYDMERSNYSGYYNCIPDQPHCGGNVFDACDRRGSRACNTAGCRAVNARS